MTSFFMALIGLVVLAVIIAGLAAMYKCGYCWCPSSQKYRAIPRDSFRDLERQCRDYCSITSDLQRQNQTTVNRINQAVIHCGERESGLRDHCQQVVAKAAKDTNQRIPRAYYKFNKEDYINWHARTCANIIQNHQIKRRLPEGTMNQLRNFNMPFSPVPFAILQANESAQTSQTNTAAGAAKSSQPLPAIATPPKYHAGKHTSPKKSP